MALQAQDADLLYLSQGSENFWLKLAKLAEDAVDWGIQDQVLDALSQEREARMKPPENGNSRRGIPTADSWLPVDVTKARKRLEEENARVTQLLWCGIPTFPDIGRTNHGDFLKFSTCIDATSRGIHDSHFLKCLELNLESIIETVGKGFISEQKQQRVIHQDIATILQAIHVLKRLGKKNPLTLISWDTIEKHLAAGTLINLIESQKSPRVLIFVAHVGAAWSKHKLDQFYNHLATIKSPRIRVYPSEQECHAVNFKISDIIALDEIAQRSTEWDYSFRPQTCFGDDGVCKIPYNPNDWMIVKRSHSDGSSHVKRVRMTDRMHLACQVAELENQPEQRKSAADEPDAKHFHQEYIEPLRSHGEYRVFLCGNNIEVVAYSHFLVAGGEDGEIGNMVARSVTLDDFLWFSSDPEEQRQKLAQLQGFTRYNRTKLLERNEPGFESLEIGVRLDVGVSELSPQGRFFVLEITRWWNANYMPTYILPYPHIGLSESYGAALAHKLWAGEWAESGESRKSTRRNRMEQISGRVASGG